MFDPNLFFIVKPANHSFEYKKPEVNMFYGSLEILKIHLSLYIIHHWFWIRTYVYSSSRCLLFSTTFHLHRPTACACYFVTIHRLSIKVCLSFFYKLSVGFK